jgi:hypothetical protein
MSRRAIIIAAVATAIIVGVSWKVLSTTPGSPSSLSKPAVSAASDSAEAVLGGEDDIPRTEASKLPVSEVILPFVGKIATRRSSHPVSLIGDQGAKVELPFKVDYTFDGRFVRALYENPNPKRPVFPVEEVEFWHKQGGQQITGLPSKPMHASWEVLLKGLSVADQLAGSDRVEVTYEMFTDHNFAPRPVIAVSIIGVRESALQGSVPVFRVRYVFDENGKFIFLDNRA